MRVQRHAVLRLSTPTRNANIAVCSWESRQIPNLSHGVRLLAPLLRYFRFVLRLQPTWLDTERHWFSRVMNRTGRMDAGAKPAVGSEPCGCDGQHGSLRNCRTRFDSSAGYLRNTEYGTTNTSSECGGFARDPAKVEDQVRLLVRTL